MAFLPFLCMSLIWGVVGIVLPFFAPKGPNRSVMQLALSLTGITCWLFWLCCYLCQMNPLIGPKIKTTTIAILAKEWGNPISDL